MPRISAIICAYNEEQTIGTVLSAVRDVKGLHEVIVVDDASHDKTAEVVRSFPFVRLLTLEKNGGKTNALAQGFKIATGTHALLLDADLVGITAADIERLIEPVVSGATETSIGMRKNSLLVFKLMGLDFISGERLFPLRFVADKIDEMTKLPRFGFETFLNHILIREKSSLAVVYWPNVTHRRKRSKIGLLRGTLAELKMVKDILLVLPLTDIVAQQAGLLRLKKAKVIA